MRRLLLLLVLSLFELSLMSRAETPPAVPHPVPSIQDTETRQQRDARMAWWRVARFGMFIHWGLYSVPAGIWNGKPVGGTGEWLMLHQKITVANYKAIASQFDPTKFDADQWVSIAKAAGMKYIVITAKHHDGFAMFDSKADPFNIADATPFKRDPLKELAVACQKQGIKLGFYYSQDQDWTAPGGAMLPKRGPHWDPAQNGDFATYVKNKVIPQLEELLNNYQPAPAVIWFDTPTHDMTPELAGQIVAVLNKHPNLIWNDRLGGGYNGDMVTPEQHVPPQGYPGQDWETCMTMNNTWGYKTNDLKFKPAEVFLRNLIDIASKGGNYLLNVGPDGTGTIPAPEVERLKAIGQWLNVNGESIYGTGPTAFGPEDGSYDPVKKDAKGDPVFHASEAWRCTTKPGELFIHLLKWPGASFHLSPVKGTVAEAYMLADPKQGKLQFTQNGSDVTVTLPATAPDPIDSVLVLKVTGT